MNQKQNNTNNIFEQAVYLLEKQKWSVIPVGVDKKPLIDWKEYQGRRPSRAELMEWLTKYQKANLAVVTGKISNLIVIDIDPRHGGSDDDFLNIGTIKVKTGGGGWHYYFLYEDGFQNKAGIKPGIDIRAEGGYVVIPPSIHSSGKSYEWLVKPIPSNILVPLPPFIKDWVKNPNGRAVDSNWDKNLLGGVSAGSRNNSAASVAGKLLVRFRQDEWENEAWPFLQGWNAKNYPPLSESELRSVFDSIATKESIKPKSGTETPHSLLKGKLLDSHIDYADVESKVKLLLPNSQTALKLVLAVALSSQFKNPLMLWLLLVGVPSSGKTDIVRLIRDADATYYLDNLTQNAFISGERATTSNKVHDLLPLIDKRCLVIKDWTSIFSLDEKMTKKLLGDLVGIYDKEFTKFSSRRGNVSYNSAFSQLGCITPATLNKHTNYMNMVGPRFLAYTMPSSNIDDSKTSYDLIFSNKDRSIIEKEARTYTSSYLAQLSKQSFNIKSFSVEIQHYLRAAAELMSNCRGIVVLQAASFKNEEGEEVKYYEILDVQVEEPWRAVQQLIALSKYLAIVVGRSEVGPDELEIIKEVVISSMPADRSQALRSIKDNNGLITAKELGEKSEKSSRTSRRLLDELFALKVLEKNKGNGPIANAYEIAHKFKDFLLLDPAEFMSSFLASGTQTPHSINAEKDKFLDEAEAFLKENKGKTEVIQGEFSI